MLPILSRRKLYSGEEYGLIESVQNRLRINGEGEDQNEGRTAFDVEGERCDSPFVCLKL